MTTVLVTGATGFVGSHVLEALTQQEGLKVIAACRDSKRLLPGFSGEVREGDLRDHDYVSSLLEGVDVVCHCMAWTSLWGHTDHSRELYLEPSLNFFHIAQQQGVERLVNVSTTSAASPNHSSDAMSRGIPRAYWPHLSNVVALENYLRDEAARTIKVVNLRLGIFAGSRYALGLLPILLPRLKTHLVPWVAGGRTSLPIIDGRDIGQAVSLAATAQGLAHYESFNIVGPEVPSVRRVIEFIHDEFGFPTPHFSVPFPLAYAFAWLMEKLDPLVPWDPLVTRSIIHLLEEVAADNSRAEQVLGYQPKHSWQEAIRRQLAEMETRQTVAMPMYRAIK